MFVLALVVICVGVYLASAQPANGVDTLAQRVAALEQQMQALTERMSAIDGITTTTSTTSGMIQWRRDRP
jgi:uncharacterized protein YoxC